MAQYVYTMRRVGKLVPPKRTILKNISLNFFPGAKIGVLGLNGSGKSSLLKIMAGVDDNYEGEASILGKPVNESSAHAAGQAAVAGATPLSNNAYKVQLAATAVKRAILRAADMLEGGL